MADISKITATDGTTYDLKDASARTSIAALDGNITRGVITNETVTLTLSGEHRSGVLVIGRSEGGTNIGTAILFPNYWSGSIPVVAGSLGSWISVTKSANSSTITIKSTSTWSVPYVFVQ